MSASASASAPARTASLWGRDDRPSSSSSVVADDIQPSAVLSSIWPALGRQAGRQDDASFSARLPDSTLATAGRQDEVFDN